MGNKKKLNIVILLDETGSMARNKGETITGLNKYLDNCQADKKLSKANISLTRFNTLAINTDIQDKKASEIPRLTMDSYDPAASTNLYDAIGITIKRLSDKVGDKDGALMVIITDGEENSSSEYTKEDIRALIQEKEAKGWSFVYLGMGFDAFAAGGAMGISLDNIARNEATVKGYANTFESANKASRRYAAGGQSASLLSDIDD